MSAHQASPLEVAVGVITDNSGRYLLSRRHEKAHQGGKWEFPGGKLEAGETPVEALRRELMEELGVCIMGCTQLITIPFDYADLSVRLHVYRVNAFSGVPEGREGQIISWFELGDLSTLNLPEASRGIVSALELPDRYLITPEPFEGDHQQFLNHLDQALGRGIRLVQLRAKALSLSSMAVLAEAALKLCHHYDARLILNGPLAMARRLGVDGVHLTSLMLGEMGHDERPQDLWVSAACHNLHEIDLANQMGVDFAVCSPVRMTPSHPGSQAIGWSGFYELCSRAAFPVYALGGMQGDDTARVRQQGGQGIAAIRALWDEPEEVNG